jgi:hypothetical protein
MKKAILLMAIFACAFSACTQQNDIRSYASISDLLNGEPYAGVFEVTGVVKTGEQTGKGYCPDGYYLTDDETPVLIRTKSNAGEDSMFLDQNYLGKTVVLRGTFDKGQIHCEAMICQCETYVVADSIEEVG